MARKSSVKLLPPKILAEVNAAIKRGSTLDEIVAMLQKLGQDISRSAMGRYSKDFAGMAAREREMTAIAEAFGKEFGDADNQQTRLMIHLLRSVITRAVMPMASGEDIELTGKQLADLARAVKDVTSASKTQVDREAKIRDEEKKRVKDLAAKAADEAGRKAGASPETIARIRAEILGIN